MTQKVNEYLLIKKNIDDDILFNNSLKILSKYCKLHIEERNKLNSKRKIALIFIIFYIFCVFCTFKDKDKYFKKNASDFINNKGYLKVNTTHKSKFDHYNYTENIIVYKDLFKNISYVPISEKNSIVYSNKVSNEEYFNLCKNKTLLDNTKYKRSINPKISVIMPYYNKDKFSLFIPLRSIQNQSFKDLEIIIVDDGSSENKINEVIREMENDNRIIFLRHKINKGTLVSRLDGVRYASGEYILNIDQDDLFLDNLVFQNIYMKAKEFDVDILQYSSLVYKNTSYSKRLRINVPKMKLIKQPELKVIFLKRKGKNRLGGMSTRMIWDKFVKREKYLKAIDDLGDEYLNHKFFLYEDTLIMFELSQIANSYYYYNETIGYRHNFYTECLSRNIFSYKNSITAVNQLYFIKLLLYKIFPIYDRYHIYKEWGLVNCGSEVIYLDKKYLDLLQEVLEVIDELERLYNNTCKELLDCAKKIKYFFRIS